MDKPICNKGTINYRLDNGNKVVEFYYPKHIGWKCVKCGACCGDVDQKTRMILLLPDDIKRIEETEEKNFYQEWDEDNFIGLMCKKVNGKCVFHTLEGCSIYESRALLCRMYPFWLEKKDESFVFGVSHACPGTNKEDYLEEAFFANLLQMALRATGY
jgi:Fe-S-cluster containining protein